MSKKRVATAEAGAPEAEASDAYPTAVTDEEIKTWSRSPPQRPHPILPQGEGDAMTSRDFVWRQIIAASPLDVLESARRDLFRQAETEEEGNATGRICFLKTASDFERVLAEARRHHLPVAFLSVARWMTRRAPLKTLLGLGTVQSLVLTQRALVPLFIIDADTLPDVQDRLNLSEAALPSLAVAWGDEPGDSDNTRLAAFLHHHGQQPGEPAVFAPAVWVEKAVRSALDLVSTLVAPPVGTLDHLIAVAAHYAAAGGSGSGSGEAATALPGQEREEAKSQRFLLAYTGAVWCPPCLRVMPFIAATVRRFLSESGSGKKKVAIAIVKADRDGFPEFGPAYNIEKIPSFVLCKLPPSEGADVNPQELIGAMTKPLAVWQNSDPSVLARQLEEHCTPLSFGLSDDVDF